MTSITRAAAAVLLILTACATEDEPSVDRTEDEPSVDSTALPVEVSWTNLVGVAATGNALVKTGATVGWNAGASSVESLSGDGFVEFTTAEATTAKMAGLGSGDASRHYGDIEFGIQLRANGTVAVYEAGTLRGSFGAYAAGDLFRVEVVAGEVFYKKNGVTFHASLTAASFPLVVDTSLSTPGATVEDVVLVSTGLDWQNAFGVAVSGRDLTKTITGSWNAGASSVQTLTGDGFLEFTTGEATAGKMAGLSSDDASLHYADIDFAFYLRANGTFAVYEAGVARTVTLGTYRSGDTFRIEVTDGMVSYSVNGGAPLYTSQVAPAATLRVDTSFATIGGTVQNVTLTEAAHACPAYDGGGPVCDGSFVVNNSIDLAEIASCADITGNLTIQAPGMTVIALPALERVGGNLTITGNDTLTRLRLPELKQVGGTFRAEVFPSTVGFDLSSLRTGNRIETRRLDDAAPLSFPCLDTSGTLYAQEWNGSAEVTAPLHVPRLRQVVGSSFISAHLDAPLLESVSGGISDGTIDAPRLVTIARNVGGPFSGTVVLDAPALTSIGGDLHYWDGSNLPSLERAASLIIRETDAIELPNLVEVTGHVRGLSLSSCNTEPTAATLELPALERAGGINLCWPALEQVSMPRLEVISNPSRSIGGLLVRPSTPAIPLTLPALIRIKGPVDVSTSASFALLATVRGQVTVRFPMSAPALTQVDGSLFLQAPLSADALSVVVGRLTVSSVLTSLSLPGLTSVDAFLAEFSSLTSLNLPSLTTVTGSGTHRDSGDFWLEASEITELDLPSLQSVEDELAIVNNDALTALTAPVLTSLGPTLRIVGNAVLPSCYATDLRDQLVAAGWTGTATINGNNGTGSCP